MFTTTARRHYSSRKIHDVVIVAATRTPIGSFQSSLSALSATQLGGIAIESVVKQAGIAASDVNEVYMGNVCAAGLGQAPARQAAIFGGKFVKHRHEINDELINDEYEFSKGYLRILFAQPSTRYVHLE